MFFKRNNHEFHLLANCTNFSCFYSWNSLICVIRDYSFDFFVILVTFVSLCLITEKVVSIREIRDLQIIFAFFNDYNTTILMLGWHFLSLTIAYKYDIILYIMVFMIHYNTNIGGT